MKLLNPTQVKENSASKQASDITQAAYLKDVLDKLQKSINAETARFEQNLADQRKVYSDEKIALQSELKALDEQIRARREERVGLMIPINTLKQEAEKALKEAEIKKIKVTEREEELESLIENVQNKLDDLSTRENDIVNAEAVLARRKIGIDEESEMVSKGHEKLNSMIAEFNDILQKKNTEIDMAEKRIETERRFFKEYVDKKEKEFAEIRRGLADRQGALERGFAELKRLKEE